ncbi:MAG TPA: hypothetical protein VK828_12065 [Terriglobales bacterium]|jgi:predicted acyltransferase (DUF342 family)|nr:hypothetical protein [Terriglobales bacterium]
MLPWAPLALTTVTAVLVALPVTPALYELWKRSDASPLPTSRHDGRIANFADVLQTRLEPLRPQLERCCAERNVSRASLAGMEILLVGTDKFDFDLEQTQGVSTLMIGAEAQIPAGKVVDADVYADGPMVLGEKAALRAAYGCDDIILGENSTVLRWLHGDGNIYLRPRSAVYGRLSAGHAIHLERGCAFQHMHAPEILTVNSGDTRALATSAPHACEAQKDIKDIEENAGRALAGDQFTTSRPRLRVEGDFSLPPGETLDANVIATGELHIGRGARLLGSAKSYKDTVIDEGACVYGSIVCGGTVWLGPRTFAAGPVMAENDVLISRGARVGSLDAPTTISSTGANIAAGCRLHGTVWARVRGNIEA